MTPGDHSSHSDSCINDGKPNAELMTTVLSLFRAYYNSIFPLHYSSGGISNFPFSSLADGDCFRLLEQ